MTAASKQIEWEERGVKGVRRATRIVAAILLGVGIGLAGLTWSGHGPFARGAPNSTLAQYSHDWATTAKQLDWPAPVPRAPAFLEGSPSHYGRTVAETSWLCEWSRAWLNERRADSPRANEALKQLATWQARRDLWLTGNVVEPALAAAEQGDRAPLAQIVRANCAQ